MNTGLQPAAMWKNQYIPSSLAGVAADWEGRTSLLPGRCSADQNGSGQNGSKLLQVEEKNVLYTMS